MRNISVLIFGTLFSAVALFLSTPSLEAGHLYAPNRIIVKFKDDSPLAALAQDLFEKKVNFQEVINNDYLDNLNKIYKLKEISPLSQEKRSMEDIIKKFPQRSKRMPPNVQVQNVKSVYIFEFEPKLNRIKKICEAYSKDPHIEYAQPDYYVKKNN